MNRRPRALLLASLSLAACSDDLAGTTTAAGTTGDTTAPATTGAPATTTADPSSTSAAATTTASDPTTGAATTTTTTTTTTGDPSTTTAAGTTGAPACAGGGLGPGDHDIMLEFDGKQRAAIVHVPANYDPQTPTPLVLNLHGFTMNAQQQVAFTGMNATADADGFVVAYGDGLGNSWNAGGCCGTSLQNNVDDVGFLRALALHLETELCIDPARVYATGMSNGGYMSHRLACEAADMFAAVGPVSASLGLPDCAPARPVPIILFNGTADALVPYAGGLFPGAKEVFAGWAERNGCTGEPTISKQTGSATCETYDTCEAGAKVTLCTLAGMGHCWPGQPVCPYGAANTDLSADDELWSFFSQFTLP